MWVGAAVMAALFVYVALRGPKNTAPLQADAEAAPEIEVTDHVAAR